MTLLKILIISSLLLFSSTVLSQHAHHGEEEETDNVNIYESSSLWAFETSNYELRACTSNGEIISSGGMIFDILPMSKNQHYHDVEEEAVALYNTFSSEKVNRQSLVAGEKVTIDNMVSHDSHTHESGNNDTDHSHSHAHSIYQIEFPEESSEGEVCVGVSIEFTNAGEYVLFQQHAPSEVSIDIKNVQTSAVISALECFTGCEDDDNSSGSGSTNWSVAVLASLVISLTSLLGVIVLGFSKNKVDTLIEYMTSFAVGCLLGVAFFHLYPEGSGYVSDLHGWVSAICVLGGILFSLSVEQIVHAILGAFHIGHHHEHHNSESMPIVSPKPAQSLIESSKSYHLDGSHVQSENNTGNHSIIDAHPTESNNAKHDHTAPLGVSIIWLTAVGDFCHAFVDGVVLAVAFKSCSAEVGWAVTLGVLMHEVPHRLGDFFIFLKAGASVTKALAINFAASLSSLLGVVLLFSFGEVSGHVLGFLMLGGTGALLFIAMTQLIHPMLAEHDRVKMLIHLFAFLLGCGLIWISALKETVCGDHH